MTRDIRDGESAFNGIEGSLEEQDRMKSSKTGPMRMMTHVILCPNNTSPVFGVYDFVGSTNGRPFEAIKQPGPVVLTREIRQNCRSEQESGDEGGTEEHWRIYGWSKEGQLVSKVQCNPTFLYERQVILLMTAFHIQRHMPASLRIVVRESANCPLS